MLSFQDYGYGDFDRRRPIGPAQWDRFDLLFLHTGRVAIRFMNQREQVLVRGEGVLIYPHTWFAGRSLIPRSTASVQHFRIEAGAAKLLEPFRRLVGKSHGYELCRPANLAQFNRDVARAMHWSTLKQTPLVHDLRVAQLAIILGQLSGVGGATLSGRAPHRKLDEAVALMSQRVAQPLTIQEMAQQAGMSVSHFRAAFRARFGVSPARRRDALRISEAARLLRQTQRPIKDIAHELGFDELANFYRSFRRHMAMPPAEYRRRYALRG